MERRNLPVLPVANNDPDLVKEPERQFGGPQSGLPPPYIVGQELAPYLIVGIDFGTIDCRVATFVKNEPRSILLPVIESRIHFPNYAVDPSEPCATTLYVKEYLGKSFVCKVGDAVYSPADLAVPVLQRVKRDTENSSERLLAKAVITTPPAQHTRSARTYWKPPRKRTSTPSDSSTKQPPSGSTGATSTAGNRAHS
jgi:hypothetical protein